jgi:hypothetical protein
MTVSDLNDVIIALVTTIGIAAAVSLAFALAGRFFERSKAQAGKPIRVAAPAQYETQSDDRELVLR